MGTYGSRSLAVGGTAIIKAMEKVEAKAKKIAAHLLEAAEADIVIENGEFKVTGTDESIALPRSRSPPTPRTICPTAWSPASRKPRSTIPPTSPSRRAFISARSRSIPDRHDDFRQVRRGRRLRPAHQSDDRRRPGPRRPGARHRPGLAHGAAYDSSGQLVTGSFMDYTMPRADDLPSFNIEPHPDAVSGQSARRQGLRRGRRDRRTAAVINAITDAIGTNKLRCRQRPTVCGTRSTARRKAAFKRGGIRFASRKHDMN